jgi:hypothetical protein
MREIITRSIVKAIVYRMIAIFITYAILRSWSTTFYIHAVVTVAYVINERVWSYIEWGYSDETKNKS